MQAAALMLLAVTSVATGASIDEVVDQANRPCNNYTHPFGKQEPRGHWTRFVRTGFGDVADYTGRAPATSIDIPVPHICNPKGNEHVVRFRLKCDTDYAVSGAPFDVLHQGLLFAQGQSGLNPFACSGQLSECSALPNLEGIIRVPSNAACQGDAADVVLVFGAFFAGATGGVVRFDENPW